MLHFKVVYYRMPEILYEEVMRTKREEGNTFKYKRECPQNSEGTGKVSADQVVTNVIKLSLDFF